MWPDAGRSTGNDVHADEKNLLSGCIGEIKENLTRLNLQNSGLVPILFFRTICRSFSKEISHPGCQAAVFRIGGWFYDGEMDSTTAISSAVSPYSSYTSALNRRRRIKIPA
jgi:hypothetical protein